MKNKLDRLWLYSLYGLALFPVLPRGIESILMILFFIISIALFFIDEKTTVKKNTFYKVLIFGSIFILYILGLLYSDNLKSAFKYIQKSLPLIMFPLVFGVFRKSILHEKHINVIKKIFVSSLAVGLLISYLYLILKLDSQSTNWDFRDTLEKLTDVHGTYISLWVGFALLISGEYLIKTLKNKSLMQGVLSVVLIVYFLFWQVKLGARTPLMITLICLITLLFLQIKKIKIVVISSLALGLLITIFTITNPSYYNRIKELKNHKFNLPKGDYNVDFAKITNEDIRNGIYYCSGILIKESLIIGHGIGDVDDKLQNCYDTKIDSNVYNIFKFNSHNQYLHILLASGLTGLLLFLASLFLSFFISIKTSNNLYLVFSILMLFCLLTENILSRHDGILFYSFFNAIFAFTYCNKK